MKRYIALLRGVNISGKNKVSMQELKEHCANLGYREVATHLNSGNIVFSAEESKETVLGEHISTMIQERFGLFIPVFVISQEDLKGILKSAPSWWATEAKDQYDNLIFVIPPAAAESIYGKIGQPSNGIEKICICKNTIFWSFDRNHYAKSNWWKKTASSGIGEMITIRTANTVKKISEL